jgi:hypothetical protein
MRFRVLSLAAIVAIGLFTVSAQAQEAADSSGTKITVDLNDLDQSAQSAVIAAKAKETAPTKPTVTVDEAKKWTNIGKGLGDAISSTCKALSMSVNDFIKTPAGLLTVAMLVLYLFGHTIWSIVGGSIIWLVLGLVIWKSATKFLIPVRLTSADGEITFLHPYDFASTEARVMCAVAHAGTFLLLSVMMLIIMF